MKPEVQRTGTDGNVFAIIGTVARTLRNVGMKAEATELTNKALSSESYDAVLRLAMTYCDVS